MKTKFVINYKNQSFPYKSPDVILFEISEMIPENPLGQALHPPVDVEIHGLLEALDNDEMWLNDPMAIVSLVQELIDLGRHENVKIVS